MKKTLSIAALLTAAILTLAACGSNETTSGGSSSTASDTHNPQDVTFASGMIPHHEQAITMARMAQQQGGSAEVKQLADDIEAAQGPEIDTMSGWLEAWGEDVPSGSMSGMGDGDMGDQMPGMMSDGDLKKLDNAGGASFDRLWLRGMIAHHKGAVQMSETEITEGENPAAVGLAKRIKAAQNAEIAKMKSLLGG